MLVQTHGKSYLSTIKKGAALKRVSQRYQHIYKPYELQKKAKINTVPQKKHISHVVFGFCIEVDSKLRSFFFVFYFNSSINRKFGGI